MSSQGDTTKVDVETDFTLTGRLARFGRGGMIQDVSNRLLRDFSSCLQSSIEAEQPSARRSRARSAEPAPAKPVSGLSLFFGVLMDRLRRLFGGGR